MNKKELRFLRQSREILDELIDNNTDASHAHGNNTFHPNKNLILARNKYFFAEEAIDKEAPLTFLSIYHQIK